MKTANKMIFWFVLFGFVFLNIMAANSGKPALMRHVYDFAFLYKTFVIVWILFLAYIIVAFSLNGTLFEKLFLPFIGEKPPESETALRMAKALYLSFLLLAFSLFILSFEMVLITGHKCKTGKVENCVIEQSSLRTVWLPAWNPSSGPFPKERKFEYSGIEYFSARIGPRNRGALPYLLFLILAPAAAMRIMKLSGKRPPAAKRSRKPDPR